MIEDKIATGKQCANKKHTFIVAAWQISPNKRNAIQFICQSCLILVDKSEFEVAGQHHCQTIEKAKIDAS